jgi:formate dehydrogenase assembly factor FdhD
LELRASEEFERLRAAADDFRQEYQVAERQRAESQGLVDSLIKSEASLQQQVIRLRTECGSGGNSAASAAAQKGLEDDLARFQAENHQLVHEIKQLKSADETRRKERMLHFGVPRPNTLTSSLQ